MATNHKIEQDSETIETALTYHERTKHHYHRYANSLGYMDWDAQSDPNGTAKLGWLWANLRSVPFEGVKPECHSLMAVISESTVLATTGSFLAIVHANAGLKV
ncbi:MAG: hypothetical protein O7C75_12675 [Verrucomicrobia bacterium]|nr:hypothetical protein [Verrucomicrobiota bacterium]